MPCSGGEKHPLQEDRHPAQPPWVLGRQGWQLGRQPATALGRERRGSPAILRCPPEASGNLRPAASSGTKGPGKRLCLGSKDHRPLRGPSWQPFAPPGGEGMLASTGATSEFLARRNQPRGSPCCQPGPDNARGTLCPRCDGQREGGSQRLLRRGRLEFGGEHAEGASECLLPSADLPG